MRVRSSYGTCAWFLIIIYLFLVRDSCITQSITRYAQYLSWQCNMDLTLRLLLHQRRFELLWMPVGNQISTRLVLYSNASDKIAAGERSLLVMISDLLLDVMHANHKPWYKILIPDIMFLTDSGANINAKPMRTFSPNKFGHSQLQRSLRVLQAAWITTSVHIDLLIYTGCRWSET